MRPFTTPALVATVLTLALAARLLPMARADVNAAFSAVIKPQARRQLQQTNGSCVMFEGFSVDKNTRVKPETAQNECAAAVANTAACIPCICSLYAIFINVTNSNEWQTDPRAFIGSDEQQRAVLEQTALACLGLYSQAFPQEDQMVTGMKKCIDINTITDNNLPIKNTANTSSPSTSTPPPAALSPPAARSITSARTPSTITTTNTSTSTTATPSSPAPAVAASAPRSASASTCVVGLLHKVVAVLSMLFLCQNSL